MGVTILPTPVNVGRLVGSDGRAPAFVPAADDPDPVIVGGAVFVAFAPLPVIEIFPPVLLPVFAPVFAAGVVSAEDFPFVWSADERLGRFVGAAPCADAPIVSSESARTVERSGVFRNSLMMKGLYNCCAKRSRASVDDCERGSCRAVRRRGDTSRFVVYRTPTNDRRFASARWEEVKSPRTIASNGLGLVVVSWGSECACAALCAPG